MTSTVLLITVVGIWVAFLLPMWFKRNQSPHLQQADKFSLTMATLRDDSILKVTAPQPPQVITKRAIRSGQTDPGKARRLQMRRRIFAGVLVSIPVSLGFYFGGLVGWPVLLTPALGFVGFVVYARTSVAAARKRRSLNTQSTVVPPAERSSLISSLAAVRRAAAERLLATAREVETEHTAGWQSADFATASAEADAPLGLGGAWSAPEPVLPTYVGAPAATAIPRGLERDHGTWDGAAMVDAATRQQRQQALSDLIAQMQADQPVVVDRGDDTTELPRVVGA